jgi:hypothetical protein
VPVGLTDDDIADAAGLAAVVGQAQQQEMR